MDCITFKYKHAQSLKEQDLGIRVSSSSHCHLQYSSDSIYRIMTIRKAVLNSVNFLFTGVPSVLWRCWLGGRKGIRPVKKLEWWGTGMVSCLEWDANLHMAQLMPLPLTVSYFSKIQIGFTFLVPAHLGSPGKRAVKRVCVCVCVCVCVSFIYLLDTLPWGWCQKVLNFVKFLVDLCWRCMADLACFLKQDLAS